MMTPNSAATPPRAMNPIMLATEIAWPSPQINQKPPTNAKGKLSRMMDTSLSRRNTIQMTRKMIANAAGTTNGLYPVRELTMIKTDNQRVNYWAAPDSDTLAERYESAWDVPTQDMTEMYAIMQKWTDQGISADFYRRVIGDASIASSELISDYLYRVKLGLKSKYYMNQKTSNGMRQVDDLPAAQTIAPVGIPAGDEDADCEACTL